MMQNQYQGSTPLAGGGGQFSTGPMQGGMYDAGGMGGGGAFGTGGMGGPGMGAGPPGGSFGTGMGGMSNMGTGMGGFPGQQQFSTVPPGGQGAYAAAPGGAGSYSLRATQPMNILFFSAACCIIINAWLAGFVLFFNGSFMDFVNLTYIMLFGCAMAINDTPCLKTLKLVQDIRFSLKKYVAFLSRITGKGVCFIFLGSALLSAMYANLSFAFFQFTGLLLNTFVILVGLGAIVIGVMKSMKLSLCKQHLEQGVVLENAFPRFAKQFPPQVFALQSGLTYSEFNMMTNETAGIKWDDHELKMIFDALVSNPAALQDNYHNPNAPNAGYNAPASRITLTDLKDWVHGGMVFL